MLNIGKIDLTKLIPFYYGWIIVGVAGLAHFCSAPGQTYVISIFFPYWLHLLPDRLGIRDYIPSEYAQAFMRW